MRLRVEKCNSPPIWLFLAGLVVAMLSFFALLLIVPRQSIETDFGFDGVYDTGPSNRPALASALKVAAVGSSLIECGLAPDGEMEALAGRKGLNIKFSRLSRPGKDLKWLKPLLTKICQAPPDILVVEAELLALTSKNDDETESFPLLSKLRSSFGQGRMRLYGWILGEEERLLGLQASPIQQGRYLADPMMKGPNSSSNPNFDQAAYSRDLRDFVIRDISSLNEVIPILRAIKARNCIVVILPMGRSPGAAALFPPTLHRAFLTFMERLSAQGFLVDQNPIRLPQEFYSDAAHLNEKGRRRASDEFLARVPRWVEARP